MNKSSIGRIAVAVVLALSIGCSSDDARLTQLAVETADRQAAQNRELAQLNREVAAGTKRLIESDGESRTEFARAQRELQDQQAAISQALDQLESERKEAAAIRMRDPLVASAVSGAVTLLVASLPLAVAFLVLWRNSREPTESLALAELLIDDLASDRPVLLPQPGDNSTTLRLGARPSEDDTSSA